MNKYEYTFIALNIDGMTMGDIKDKLNKYGDEGWEVVLIIVDHILLRKIK